MRHVEMMKRSSLAIILLVLAALPAPARAQNRSDSKTERAREHYQQAEMYMKAEVYDLAIREYRKGYKLMPRAHGFLFNIGLAHEKAGDREKALDAFQRYLEKEPRGKKAAEARARSVALARAIRAEKAAEEERPRRAGEQAETPDDEEQPVAPAAGGPGTRGPRYTALPAAPADGPSDSARKPEGRNWTLIAVGAALIAAGAVTDLGPGSGSNGEVDALDFVPVGLYGLGAVFVITGTF